VDTATVAVIASSTVAVVSIGANVFQNERRLRHERRLADLDAVRSALDDAAAELHATAYVLDEVRSQVTQHTPDFFKSEKGTETFIELGRRGKELDALNERLRVRFGRDHEVVAPFIETNEAVLDIYRAAGLVRLEPGGDGSPASAHQVAKFHDETRDRLIAGRDRFDGAREAFIVAAQRAGGAQLLNG
jgi:hypothetical protein